MRKLDDVAATVTRAQNALAEVAARQLADAAAEEAHRAELERWAQEQELEETREEEFAAE